ncbi:bile acid:sodium symporter family protein [Stenotrophobium rhamnosiphilum]|uniref:Bile acid:sodium symporter n=1 Tax=Stenotrophobium rhamnosiphilum TaxID=2029166 RepID=A0A2T5MI63_9GAMM|nr:bile acid:sodium symporter family protein [Stenotrophobium rhamnosiphilum]PTU32271.1 bile acid:sodium symporter [Stenotrophobium rhamnosiphilum]
MATSLIITTLLPLSLFIIMSGLGLALTVGDFKRVALYPKGATIGLINLILLSPLLGFLIAKLFGLTAALAVGMVLLGASPGGTTANMLTHLARGDTALSVTMTALSSLAAVITTPIFLALASAHFLAGDEALKLDMGPIVVKVLLITLLPLSIGMAIRAFAPAFALRIEPVAKKIATVFFIGVVFVVLGSEYEEIGQHIGVIGPAVLTLNILAMTISYQIARIAKLDSKQSTAIAIELGVHNTTLAMAVGAMVAPELIVPAAVYGVFMFFTAGVFAKIMHRKNSL